MLAPTIRAQHGESLQGLTEPVVVARALERAPLLDAIEGDVELEAARARSARAYPNPQITYVREQTFGALGTGEDYLTLAQTIDLGNRRGLQGQAGEARARAAERDGEAWQLSVASEARLRFYEVLYRQARVAVLESWQGHIARALTIVARREQGGDAAPYDRRRLERERAVATGQLETERAALERACARLEALLATGTSDLRVAGELLPQGDPQALPELRVAIASRPDLLAIELRIDAAALDQRAASRWWAPDLRLEAGWKGVDLGPQGRTDGFLLGASLSIPLWDRSSGASRIAAAQAQAARGRRALLESELQGELEGARAEAVRLRRAAEEFRDQTTAASSDLVRIASAGYEGGELGLLELLDAYRGTADDLLSALDMELAARRASIDIDRLTGAALP
ncbi:MAG: TolC family protein [Sandaracinaceae bacterium]|nr:TolC family protein [Sandaracinaceae bacterium]MBP7680546.1 TolC family protein [Deltaproteobacteria bacterium]